jgi:hypothetical protein
MEETLECAPDAPGRALVLRTAGDGRLCVMTEGGAVAVGLRQCFPWSEPRRHLSLRDGDEKEVAHVHDPDSTPNRDAHSSVRWQWRDSC